jgi:TRAP-type mannitol/chloroaromatic compound transport system permease small subunit
MAFLLRCSRVIDQVNTQVANVVIWLTLLMIVIGFLNVTLRYAGWWLGMNLTSNMALEAQWYLFSIVFLFLGAYTLLRDSHVRVDVLYAGLSDHARAWINLIGTVVFLIPFCILIVYLSWPFVRYSVAVLEMSPDPGGLPRWPIKIAIPVAFFLVVMQGISLAIQAAAFLTGRGPNPFARDHLPGEA